MNAIDCEEIIDARVRGESVRSICKRLGCSLADVNDVLDRFAQQIITDKLRLHTLALELSRLDRLQEVFEQKAMDGDVAAAQLVSKLIERRCIMLGISAPPRVDPMIIEHTSAPKQDSISRIYDTIERIRSLPKPENAEESEPKGGGFWRDKGGAFHFYKGDPPPDAADECDSEPTPTNGESEAGE